MPGNLKGSLFVYQLKSDRISVSGERIQCDKNKFVQYRFKNFEVACESKEPANFVLDGFIAHRNQYLRYADEHQYLAKNGYTRLRPSEGNNTFVYTRTHLVLDFSSLFAADDAMITYYTAPTTLSWLEKDDVKLPPNPVDDRFLYVYAPFNGLINEAHRTNTFMANMVDSYDNTVIGRGIYATPVEYEALDVHVLAEPLSKLELENPSKSPASENATSTEVLYPL